MEGINTKLVDKLLITPTNVKDGIRAGAFQGMGFLGRAPGIYLGDVFPYSIAPSNNGEDPILTGTIPANATIYLPLGSINFAPPTPVPGVTLQDSPEFPSGKCIKLDYERTIEFRADQACTITTSCMDRYLQKIVVQTGYTSTGNRTAIGPAQYYHSIKVKNNSSSEATYDLYVGQKFGLPYMMLYSPVNFTKMVIYDGYPLVTSDNIPAALSWLPVMTLGYDPESILPPTIFSGFTRTSMDLSSLFLDTGPFADTPFDGTKILTFYTQHYGFGNLPPFATREQQAGYLNNNNVSIVGVKPYSENFVPWFN